MPRGDRAFLEVTERAPCPICGSGGWCRVARDGSVVLCRREAHGGRGRVDRAGVPYYVHRLRGGDPVPVGEAVARRVDALTAGEVPDLAPVEARTEVYAATLRALALDATHRDALRTRGLPDAEIARRGYRTLPPPGPPWRREDVARELANRFGPDLAHVPGFHVAMDRRGRSYWKIAGRPGILIPARDLDGRIVAFKIRVDEAGDGPRYRTLSSNWTDHPGPSPGSPVHVPLRLDGGHAPGIVRLTEGELKADVCTCLCPDRILTVSVPGVGAWRAALPVLEALRAPTVRLAFDRDAWTNPHVARALRDAAAGIEAAGFNLEVERW